MSINIDIQWLSSPKQRESVSDAMLRRWVKQALAPSVENASITLRIVGQTEG